MSTVEQHRSLSALAQRARVSVPSGGWQEPAPTAGGWAPPGAGLSGYLKGPQPSSSCSKTDRGRSGGVLCP